MFEQSMEMIQRALAETDSSEANIQPAVLMHKNIDHDKVVGYTKCHVNGAWEKTFQNYVKRGWVVFRIQTEFSFTGHNTFAYLAKMA